MHQINNNYLFLLTLRIIDPRFTTNLITYSTTNEKEKDLFKAHNPCCGDQNRTDSVYEFCRDYQHLDGQ